MFTDRSYIAVVSYLPDCFDNNDFTKKQVKEYTGTLSETDYSILCTIINEEWIDPATNSNACDGEAWQIKMYYPSGRKKKSSGTLGYIYHQPIERLVEILNKQINEPVL